MQITAKQIRELADKKMSDADGNLAMLRASELRKRAYELANNLDDLKELLGVSYLSVEINDSP